MFTETTFCASKYLILEFYMKKEFSFALASKYIFNSYLLNEFLIELSQVCQK